MKRSTWNLFCFFSLLVFLSGITLWVRSYFGFEWITWVPQQSLGRTVEYIANWSEGELCLQRVSIQYATSKPLGLEEWEYVKYPPMQLDVLGYAHFQKVYSGDLYSYRRVVAPFWSFLLAAIPPCLWWRRRRRDRGRGFPLTVTSAAEQSTTGKPRTP